MNKYQVTQVTQDGQIRFTDFPNLPDAVRFFRRHLWSPSIDLRVCGSLESIAHSINYNFFKIQGL